MSQPFTWLVSFTVPAEAVAAGFGMTDLVAADMLHRRLEHISHGGAARVLSTPNAAHIANLQGVPVGHADRERYLEALRAATPHTGAMQTALLQARAILQSPDVVRTGIDVEPTIKAIEQAIAGLIGELP